MGVGDRQLPGDPPGRRRPTPWRGGSPPSRLRRGSLMTSTMRAEPATAPAERYQAAERLLGGSMFGLIVGGQVVPNFIAATDRFWFVHQTSAGHEFRVVDPRERQAVPVFDHEHLAACLTAASGQPCEPGQLPFGNLHATADGTFLFGAHGRQWRYDGNDCIDIGDAQAW